MIKLKIRRTDEDKENWAIIFYLIFRNAMRCIHFPSSFPSGTQDWEILEYRRKSLEYENYAVIETALRRESTLLPSNDHADNSPSDTTYGLLTTANVKSHSEFLLLEKFAFLFNNKRNWKATKRKKFNLNYNTRM